MSRVRLLLDSFCIHMSLCEIINLFIPTMLFCFITYSFVWMGQGQWSAVKEETKTLIKLHVSLVAGFRDWVPKELQRVGCVELLNTVQKRVRPKLHAFGGIHEGTENKMCLYEAARGDISTETLAEFLV